MNATCKWQSPYCTKKGCWEYTNQSSCNLTSSDLSCSWATMTSSGWCEEVGCWNFWNNQTQCEGSGLNCDWKDYSWCEVTCWNMTNSSACGNNSRCKWMTSGWSSAWCDMKGCWNYFNQSACVNKILISIIPGYKAEVFHPIEKFYCTFNHFAFNSENGVYL